MNVRLSSIEAYNKIKENGLLSKRRQEVYEILFANRLSTGMELQKHFPPGTVDSQIRARLNELRELGIAREMPSRVICKVTGHLVTQWDIVEGALPINLTVKQKLEKEIAALETKLAKRQLKLSMLNGPEL